MTGVGRTEAYRRTLRETTDWEAYLLRESRLPGPRANLELLAAVADEGTTDRLLTLAAVGPDDAPTGTPGEFLAACGAAGLGARIARGEEALWPRLRALASDPRWRVREGVAMGLQRIGDVDMDGLLRAMDAWAEGGPLERRAVVAGLCEPRLLTAGVWARAVFDLLDRVTESIAREPDRRSDGARALRKALGYGWSVAVAAFPSEGRRRFERWSSSADPDHRWIVRENLKKKRLQRVDAGWARALEARVAR